MKNKEKCTYCNKHLEGSYSFTYGIPGITRVYSCNRFLCKITRKFKREKNDYLRPFVKRLIKIVDKTDITNL